MIGFTLFSLTLADATSSAGSKPGFDILGFAPFILILVVMYFLLIRPQQKKMKQHTDMVSALRRGDKVIIAGGIIGTIHKVVNNEEITVEIADNVQVRVLKANVTQVLARTEPVDLKASAAPAAEKHKAVTEVKNALKSAVSTVKKEVSAADPKLNLKKKAPAKPDKAPSKTKKAPAVKK